MSSLLWFMYKLFSTAEDPPSAATKLHVIHKSTTSSQGCLAGAVLPCFALPHLALLYLGVYCSDIAVPCNVWCWEREKGTLKDGRAGQGTRLENKGQHKRSMRKDGVESRRDQDTQTDSQDRTMWYRKRHGESGRVGPRREARPSRKHWPTERRKLS